MNHIEKLTMKPFSFGGANEPDQLCALASSFEGDRIQHGVWESGPGELNLKFSWSETVYILDGKAEVENLDTGERFTLSPGVMMSFERGSNWRWNIPFKLKKVFTLIDEG